MPSRDELFARYRYDKAAEAAPRAHVRMNFVTSADGAATDAGLSGGLGGRTDRVLMSVLRAMSDAVLVGAGTVRAEGYGGLSIPPEMLAWRRTAMPEAAAHPRVVIASSALALEPEMPVFTQTERRPLILTSRAAAQAHGRRFAGVADVRAAGETELDLEEVLGLLPDIGIGRVLCEGGPRLFGSLLEADLVSEVCLTTAPVFTAGDAGRIATSGTAVRRGFALRGHFVDDEGFLFTRYVRRVPGD